MKETQTPERVEQLLEELLDSGATPEQVCHACPELLAQVRAGWQRLRILRDEVGELFPRSPCLSDTIPPPLSGADLPRIRGYDVEEVVGRGGVGVVYKAWHQRLRRPVAIKMLLVGAYAQPQELERFLREAETLAGLRHANIVQIHEAGDADGRPYFTMEFVEGGSLAQKLVGAPHPARQAAALVAVVAEAVHAAHQHAIVHRDLKPGNVLLTADGTPKLTDFGLARRLEGAAGLTQSGAALGTPSYMAPEQALGKSHAVGPAADTYALGAILYELLTGRPPFRAETAEETVRQVVALGPVAPSRLNAAAPRDLETICLKCLEKSPEQRYPSARALADDLQRFLRHEPIVARPVGALGRTVRWARCYPTGAALAATALALVVLAISSGTWFIQQRAERRGELRIEIGAAVTQAEKLRKRYHFQEAQELLEQARQLLGQTGPHELRQQVERAWEDLKLVKELDRDRLRATTLVAGRFEPGAAEPFYEQTFATAGLDGPGGDSETTAAQVRDSTVRVELVAALDDWASITEDPARAAWLLEVARAADPDPWRDRLRQPKLWQDGPALSKLVQELGVGNLSPQLATAVGRSLRKRGAQAAPMLRTAQARFPQDFWLNLELGWALHDGGRSDEAIVFYRVALALRPETSPVHYAIAINLRNLHRLDEAIDHLKLALARDPNFALAHNGLGIVLLEKGQRDEALQHFQDAIRSDPTGCAAAHCNVGLILRIRGQLKEAIHHFRESIRLDPKASAVAQTGLADLLREKGQVDEAILRYREAIRLDPKTTAGAHINLGLTLYDKGQLDEAVGHLQEAVRLEPASAVAHHNFGFVLSAKGRLNEAVEQYQEAIRLDAKVPAFHNNLGSTLYELGRLDEAIGHFQQALQLDPNLAVASHYQGMAHAARKEWNKAVRCYERALKANSVTGGHIWFEFAAALLLSGDQKGYEKACAHLIDQYGKSPGLRAYHVARTCTLAADAVAQPAQAGSLAEKELKAAAGKFWSLTEQGALHYRAGQHQEAAALFEQSLRASALPGQAVVSWLWLALAQQRLGKVQEARRWLDKATGWLDQWPDGMPARAEKELGLHLHNWLEANVLRGEADVLMRAAETRSAHSGPGLAIPGRSQ
jgi:serine/threonine-protein kinase